MRSLFTRALPEWGDDPAEILGTLAAPRRPRSCGERRPALLRLRHRRHPARGHRRRLVDQHLGSEPRALRSLAPRFGPRRGHRRLDLRSPRPARGVRRRLRHRLPNGARHLSRRGATRAPPPRRLGRGGERSAWRSAAPCHRRRRGARHPLPRPALARARDGDGGHRGRRCPRAHATGSAGSGAAPRHRPCHRLHPAGQRQHRGLRSAARDPRHRPRPTTPGCTWTAPSASGQQPLPVTAI